MIFADSSQGSTLTSYLQLFQDLDEAGEYAWGAAALAFLCRSLSNVADGESHFSGSATLLQYWIYKHFPALGTKPKTIAIEMLRTFKWKKQPSCKGPLTMFDDISIDMVNWQPHEDYTPVDTLSKEKALCRSYFISFHITKYYMPDRVLRQFGKMQAIPVGPPKWERREKRPDILMQHSGNSCEQSGVSLYISDRALRHFSVVSIRELHSNVLLDQSGIVCA
ncbi:protein MAIN-LIKE 1 [Amborella trichopoda]|uniref:protein MAIN-LIKE 1 n=1 Tax=Amborella trichopoda TaxID=13333 RepID=UPI0005D4595B|nr:protein MAIN-LIKE 1 [Amborella trichopoda]|eukprot:XP_011628181.1 protein MAIN-LIKE 1 [Amborella trichopoda]